MADAGVYVKTAEGLIPGATVPGPVGDTGPGATIAVGSVNTGAAGSGVIITNTGTATAAVLNFTIPKGDTGLQGIQGPKGDKGDPGAGNVDSVNGKSGPDIVLVPTDIGAAAASHTHGVVDLTATGTKSATTYLRGDNTWAVPPNTTYAVPTQAEAEAGTATTGRAFSAQRVSQAIAALSPVKTVAGRTGTIVLTKSDVGLSNVDNTSDTNKPISTLAQEALDNKAPRISFNPGSSGGTRRWVRLVTVDGNTPTTGAHATFWLSGTGDYGTSRRGTTLVHMVQRNIGGINVHAWAFDVENTSDPLELHTKQISDFVFELWAKVADYNMQHDIYIQSQSNATFNVDSFTTTAPTGIVQWSVGAMTSKDEQDLRYAPIAHTHAAADITSGTISIARLPVATSGTSSATLVVRADDARLSDARTPTAHVHAAVDINSGTLDIARLPVATSGTSNTTQVVRADDSRLSNARTPLSHTHLIADLPVAASGTSSSTLLVRADDSRLSNARTPTAHTHAAADIISGTIATARLGSGTANSTTFLRGDNTWATVDVSKAITIQPTAPAADPDGYFWFDSDATSADGYANITRVLHNGTAYPSRPAEAVYVEWVGPVAPTEYITGDTWVNTA